MHAERLHTQVKNPVVHVRVQWIMETLELPNLHYKARGMHAASNNTVKLVHGCTVCTEHAPKWQQFHMT